MELPHLFLILKMMVTDFYEKAAVTVYISLIFHCVNKVGQL